MENSETVKTTYCSDPGVKGLLKEKSGALLFDLVSDIPRSVVSQSSVPENQIKLLTRKAALEAAAISATLSCPGGFVSVITILPDVASIWRIQAQLVADIAASYGKIAMLRRETMIWCLFRHTASQLVRDLAVRAGTRIIIQTITLKSMQKLLRKIGMEASTRLVTRTLFRVIPVLGAIGSGAYAAYDTYEVGKTAHAYFRELPKP
jgi:hypothetical protein